MLGREKANNRSRGGEDMVLSASGLKMGLLSQATGTQR